MRSPRAVSQSLTARLGLNTLNSMKRAKNLISLLTAIPVVAASICQAQDYGFSGAFTNLFVNAVQDGSYTFKQTCGRMIAHNSNVSGPAASVAYLLKSGLPKFNQSWSLSARVTIPFSAQGLPGGSPFTEEYAEIGIGCVFGRMNFGGGLQVYPSGDLYPRVVLCETSTNGVEVFDGQGDFPFTEETVTVGVRYNSTNKALQFYADGKMLMDLDIAADGQNNSPRQLDWGMNANSVFQIVIFANSENYPVSSEVPLQMDDFSFHIDGQAPTNSPTLAINRNAVELECTGRLGQLYELQMSDNLTNWFTFRSFFGSGGLARVPVSADLGGAFYRIRP